MLSIDGVVKATVTGKPLAFKWNTRCAGAGTHTITVTATDAARNATTRQIEVTTTGK